MTVISNLEDVEIPAGLVDAARSFPSFHTENEKAGWDAFTAERTKRFALIEMAKKTLKGFVIGLAIDAEQKKPLDVEIEFKRLALMVNEMTKPVLGDPCAECGKPLQNKDNGMNEPFLDCMNSACDHHDVS